MFVHLSWTGGFIAEPTYELLIKRRDLVGALSAMTLGTTWFGENLVTLDTFNRSKSKGFYRRTTRGIAWFRNSATDCLWRMDHIKTTLEKYGHPVTI